MPITYRIDRTQSLVVSEWSGEITIDEARAHFAALRSDPDFDSTMRHLSNALSVEGTLSLGELRLLAYESPFNDSARAAVVASSDLVFGVAKQYEAVAERRRGGIRVFRELDEGLAWLGIAKPGEVA